MTVKGCVFNVLWSTGDGPKADIPPQTMSLKIASLPLDIIFEAATDLDLPDALHLLTTHSGQSDRRALLFERSWPSGDFWIKALNRIKNVRKQPLPCGPGVDISTLPLATLRGMTEHANKLDRNWPKECLRPVSVRTINGGKGLARIWPISGTNLILATSWERKGAGRLRCLDIHSGQSLTSMEFPGGQQLNHTCDEGTVELSALRLDFRDTERVTLKKEFSKIWHNPTGLFQPHNITIDEHMIAGVLEDYTSKTKQLVYYRFQEDILHSIPLDSYQEPAAAAPSCMLHQGSLYVARHDHAGCAEIRRFSTQDSSPSSDQAASGISMIEAVRADVPREGSDLDLGWCNMRTPTYGVMNVASRTSGEVGGEHFEYVHFWPVDNGRPNLEIGTPVSHRHPGKIWTLSVGSAGTSIIVRDSKYTTTLVRYISDPTLHTTAHQVDVSAVPLTPYRIPPWSWMIGWGSSTCMIWGTTSCSRILNRPRLFLGSHSRASRRDPP
ncbi:hypothetical protein FB451DRAFT_1365300, partial [Mycena latifolia]